MDIQRKTTVVVVVETVSHVAKAGLKHPMQTKITLKSWFLSPHLLKGLQAWGTKHSYETHQNGEQKTDTHPLILHIELYNKDWYTETHKNAQEGFLPPHNQGRKSPWFIKIENKIYVQLSIEIKILPHALKFYFIFMPIISTFFYNRVILLTKLAKINYNVEVYFKFNYKFLGIL